VTWLLNTMSLILTALVTLVPAAAHLLGEPAAVPETVRRTLTFEGSGQRLLELSNIVGSVRIVAEDRADVSVVATRTVEHEGRPDDAGPAVDFRQESGRVLVCGDASHCGCHVGWPGDRRGRDDERTRVRVDFEVHVPRATQLDVCTVTGGVLRVEGANGDFTLRNVNGDLEMDRVRGAGQVSTVNGSIAATFDAVPTGRSEFRTVNGSVKVSLPASLSADLRLKTMNGGLYTDFDTTPLPSRMTREQKDGRTVYRADRYAAVRVGGGGPELVFETLNGDVQIRKR
jgi:hypothetical protein